VKDSRAAASIIDVSDKKHDNAAIVANILKRSPLEKG
jgi:hypothetical protein